MNVLPRDLTQTRVCKILEGFRRFHGQWWASLVPVFIILSLNFGSLFIHFLIFIYLDVPGLSCGMWDL